MSRFRAFRLFLFLVSFGAGLMFWVLPEEVPMYTFTYIHDNPRLRVLDFLITNTVVYFFCAAFAEWLQRKQNLKSSLTLVSSYPLFASLVIGFIAALVHFNFRGYAVSFFWPWALFALPTTLTFLIKDGWIGSRRSS